MLASANTSRTSPSILEAPGEESVSHFQNLGLTRRLLTPPGEEAELVLVQIHLTTHQAVGPHLAERPGPPQQAHLAQAAAAPQVDQPTPRPLLQLQLPGGGERPPLGGGLHPGRAVVAQRLHVTPGALLQAGQVRVLEAGPDP